MFYQNIYLQVCTIGSELTVVTHHLIMMLLRGNSPKSLCVFANASGGASSATSIKNNCITIQGILIVPRKF